MTMHGDIKADHLKIGEWSADRQPGHGGTHPYAWAAKMDGGQMVRGVLVHDLRDGPLVLAAKVLAAAARPGDRQAHEICHTWTTCARDHDELPSGEIVHPTTTREHEDGVRCGQALAAEVAARGYRQRAERAEAERDSARADLDARFDASPHLTPKYYREWRNAERERDALSVEIAYLKAKLADVEAERAPAPTLAEPEGWEK